MLVNPGTYEDCKKYYQHCWVKFKEEGDHLFYVTNVDNKYIYTKDINEGEALIDHREGYTIDYVLPKKAVFQHGENAVMLSRIPARMWKKGMNKQNTEFKILHHSGWFSGDFDIHIINGFVNKPSYYSAEDALNEFEKSEHLKSVALSPRISMCHKGNIYIDTVLVGKYSSEKKKISHRKLFNIEMKALFPSVLLMSM